MCIRVSRSGGIRRTKAHRGWQALSKASHQPGPGERPLTLFLLGLPSQRRATPIVPGPCPIDLEDPLPHFSGMGTSREKRRKGISKREEVGICLGRLSARCLG